MSDVIPARLNKVPHSIANTGLNKVKKKSQQQQQQQKYRKQLRKL